MSFRFATFALALLAPMLASAQPMLYSEGQHYHKIEPAQPTHVADGKVEVVEVFSYACVHCANFEPFVTPWKKTLPSHAQFRGLPAVFSPAWEPYARAYYAAEEIGVLDTLHNPLFNALHLERKALRTVEEIAGFAADLGIDRDAFLAAANSEATNVKLQQSVDQVRAYGVRGTPSMIVNGKYLVPAAGGQATLQIVDFLVQQEAGASN